MPPFGAMARLESRPKCLVVPRAQPRSPCRPESLKMDKEKLSNSGGPTLSEQARALPALFLWFSRFNLLD